MQLRCGSPLVLVLTFSFNTFAGYIEDLEYFY